MLLPRFSALLVSGACALALGGCATDNAGTAAAMTKQSFVTQVASATALPMSVHVQATVSGHGLGLSVNGDVAVNGKSINDLVARLRANVLLPHGSATLLLTDGAAYVKTTGLPLPTSSSKPWVKLDLTDLHHSVAARYDSLMSRLDPASMLKAFRATTQLRRVGDATLHGVATTHYVVTVDTAKLLRVLGTDGMTGSHVNQMRGELPKTFAYDVWLDSSHRPARIKGAYGGIAVDVTFSSWGESVSVHAPPARLTTTVSL
jgi:hypothetical protein